MRIIRFTNPGFYANCRTRKRSKICAIVKEVFVLPQHPSWYQRRHITHCGKVRDLFPLGLYNVLTKTGSSTGRPIKMWDYSVCSKINKILALPCSLCCFIPPVLIWGELSYLFVWMRCHQANNSFNPPQISTGETKQHKGQGKAGIFY